MSGLAALPVATVAHAQNGTLYGTAVDNQGQALPGVTVTLRPPGRPPVVQVTDAQGRFRFLNLDPGTHQMKAELEGFSTVDYPNIGIRGGRSTTLEVTLSPAVEDVITVTSESPLLDERRIASGATVSEKELEKIPTARDPWVIVQQTPGVLTDRINVGGNESGQPSQFTGPSTGGGWFMVDGVIVTDTEAAGAAPAHYDFDSFEEMQVSTGGDDAPIATGGVVLNMVTKRGSNEWRGSGRYLLADDEWEVGDISLGLREDDRGLCFDSAVLGGPILKDKLWFFTGGPTGGGQENPVPAAGPALNAHFWSFYGSRTEVEYRVRVTDPAAEGQPRTVRIPGCDGSPTGLDLVDLPGYGTEADQTRALGAILLGEPDVVFPSISLTDPLVPARDSEAVELTLNRRFTNNWQLYGNYIAADEAVEVRRFDFQQKDGDAGPCLDLQVVGPADRSFGGFLFFESAFAPRVTEFTSVPLCDDRFRIRFLDDFYDATHLVLGEGVAGFDMNRAEQRSLDFSFGDMVAPRVGFTWDVGRQGRSRRYGHFGSFFESVPVDLNTGDFTAPRLDRLFLIGLDAPGGAGAATGGDPFWVDWDGDGLRDLTFLNGGDFQNPCPGVHYGAFTAIPGEGGGHLIPDPDAPPIDCESVFLQDRVRLNDYFSTRLGVRQEAGEPPPDASNFFNTGNLTHELRFGGSYRTSERTAYLNDSWQLNDKWSFNVGLRYDEVEGTDRFEGAYGGPIVKDRLWIWGSYGLSEVPTHHAATAGGLLDFTFLEQNRVRIGSGDPGSTSTWLDKGPSPVIQRPAETTWNQAGPTDLYKLEDTHVFSSNFYLSGLYSIVDGVFQRVPQGPGGRDLAGGTPGFFQGGTGFPGSGYTYGLFDLRPDAAGVLSDGGFLFGRYDLGIGGTGEPLDARGTGFMPLDLDRDGAPDTPFIRPGTLTEACPGFGGVVGGFIPGPNLGGWGHLEYAAPTADDCDQLEDVFARYDFSAALGQPLLRDRLWFFVAGNAAREEEDEDATPPPPGLFVTGGANVSPERFTPEYANPEFLNRVLGHALGQRYGSRLRIQSQGGAQGPGGTMTVAELAEAEPTLLFESLGGSTGEVVRAHLLHDGAGPISVEGFAVLEPIATDDALRRRFDAALEGATARASATIEAYCLDQAKLPLSQGELFRLAPRAVQEAYAHVGGILDAAERLRDAGLLNPDTNPESYFHSIRQWAVWTRQEGYDARGFVEAFVEHTRKNVEDGGQRWTDEIEQIVRRSAGGRWQDVEKVLETATGTR